MPPSERKGGGYRPKRKSARRRERG